MALRTYVPVVINSRCAECQAELDVARPTDKWGLLCEVCAEQETHKLAASLVGPPPLWADGIASTTGSLSLVFEHALALAVDHADPTEGAAELVGLAERQRSRLESARAQWWKLALERPDDVLAGVALTYLDEALRRGQARHLLIG